MGDGGPRGLGMDVDDSEIKAMDKHHMDKHHMDKHHMDKHQEALVLLELLRANILKNAALREQLQAQVNEIRALAQRAEELRRAN